MLKFIILFIISTSSVVAHSANSEQSNKNFKQSFLSCSIITSEHLTVLQLYQRGVPRDLAIESLPKITRAAKQRVKYVYDLAQKIGILNAYTDINTNYARCSAMVHTINGIPAADLKEHQYYFCAGENKVRFELIIMSNQNKTLNQQLDAFPNRYQPTIIDLFRLIKTKGTLAAFDLTANNLKACLNQIN